MLKLFCMMTDTNAQHGPLPAPRAAVSRTGLADGEVSLLGGKVLRRSLPLLHPPLHGDAPVLKRISLPQGELAQFHDGPEPVFYLAYVELRADTDRGNHYHKVKEESLYVLHGEVELLVQDIAIQVRESVFLHAGDLAFIPTGIAHTLRVRISGHAIEFSRTRFDPADIYPFQLI
jgi:quercetin dioxygenase-like cupin family protein